MPKLPKSGLGWWKWKFRRLMRRLRNYLYRRFDVFARRNPSHHLWVLSNQDSMPSVAKPGIKWYHVWKCSKCGLEKITNPHKDAKPIKPRSGAKHPLFINDKTILMDCQEYSVYRLMND